MKTIDYKFSELCAEIDMWKEEAEYWKIKFEEERDLGFEQTKERLENSQKGIANMLMVALSSEETSDGGIKISSEKRAQLAKDWNT